MRKCVLRFPVSSNLRQQLRKGQIIGTSRFLFDFRKQQLRLSKPKCCLTLYLFGEHSFCSGARVGVLVLFYRSWTRKYVSSNLISVSSLTFYAFCDSSESCFKKQTVFLSTSTPKMRETRSHKVSKLSLLYTRAIIALLIK